jgi:hypothetical protein
VRRASPTHPLPCASRARGGGWAAAATAAFLAALAPPAEAVERENQVGADIGCAILIVQDKSTPEVGAGIGAHYTRGLTDEFNLMVEGAWSLVALDETRNAKTPTTHPAWMANADVGVGYVLDVLRWVPYVGLLVGGYGLAGGSMSGPKVLPGVEVALGLDYRFGRTLTAGVALRQHLLSDTYPSFTQAFGRVEYSWGW